MTSYERVKTALEHKEPDKIPFDLGGTIVSGINVNALTELKKYLGMERPVEVKDTITQMADTGEEVIDFLKVDIKNVGPLVPEESKLKDRGYSDGSHFVEDEWGMQWRMPPNGRYYDVCKNPLAHVKTIADVEKYPWPNALDPVRYEKMKVEAGRIVFEEKKAYVLGRMSSGMWEHAMWMTGYEKFLMDMVVNPVVCQAIMEKILEVKMQYWERALDTVGENVLIASCADDLGTQDSLMVGLDLYKKIVWPYHKRLFEFIREKAKSNIYIFFHNDGAVMETFPLLIEAGVDIVNPFQVNCKGMDTKRFKKEFGSDLTVWGGSCDTQSVLPYGTPDEVREETKRRIEDLAPGGGFIFAPIHVIQEGVPPENILAWWDTLQKYNS